MRYIYEEKLRALCDEIKGECGLYLSLPFAGETLDIGADKIFPAASTIKIPLLALLFKDAEEGRLDLDAPVPLDPALRVRGSGVLKFLSPNITLSLYDYAVLMIIYSDNTATNQVIDALGMDRANAYFRENGWLDTELNRLLFVPSPDFPKGTASTNLTSPRDLGNMMERLLARELVSKQASERMLSIMANQQLGKLNHALPVMCPNDTRTPLGVIPEGRVIMAQKGGTLSGLVSHDTAVLLLPNGRGAAISVMTKSADHPHTLDVMTRMGKVIYEGMLAD